MARWACRAPCCRSCVKGREPVSRAYASVRALDPHEASYFDAFRLFTVRCELGEQMRAAVGVIESAMQSPFFAPHIRDGVLKRLRRLARTAIALPSTA
jgi:hypothetical protein